MLTRIPYIIILCVIAIACLAECKRVYVKPDQAYKKRAAELVQEVGKIRRELPEIGGFVVEVEDTVSIAELRANPRFSFVDEIPRGFGGAVPNDPNWSSMWHMAKLQMSEVWDLVSFEETRVNNITIAICDSGIASHSDLDASRIVWQYDYVNSDDIAEDEYGHGTHVTGIIAATVNNSIGVAGVSYGVNLIIGKVLDFTNSGTYDDFVVCMLDAANLGADIVSMSLGGFSSWQPMEDAVNALYDRGIIVNACAGNSYQSDSNKAWFPAAYNNSFAVTNIDNSDNRNSISNIGSYIDIAAPGTNILSTVKSGGYEEWTGCSMATPIVSGVSALMKAIKPSLTASELMNLFTSTAIDLGDVGQDSTFGYGRINPLLAAKTLLNQPPVISASEEYDVLVDHQLSVTITCFSSESFDSCVSFNYSTLPSFINVTSSSSSAITLAVSPSQADIGSHSITFFAIDTFDTTASTVVTIRVTDVDVPQSTKDQPSTSVVSHGRKLMVSTTALVMLATVLT